MSNPSPGRPATAANGVAQEGPATSAAAPPAPCRPQAEERTVCPGCGEIMRLWANYHRCRNCGYKESCCF